MHSKHNFDVVVIGAGLAGCTTAYALLDRGLQVALVDSAPQVAAKASGNKWGLLTPYLSTKRSDLEALYSAGYAFTHTLLSKHPRCRESFHQTGALQLPSNRRLAAMTASAEAILGAPVVHRVKPTETLGIAGITIDSSALYVPDAGFLSPQGFVEQLLAVDSSRLTLALGAACCSIKRDKTTWVSLLKDGRSFLSNSVVVCAAHESATLELTSWLPLEAIRGQTICARSNDASRALRTVVSYGGYITPDVAGMHFIGAHYSHDDNELLPRVSDTEEMLRLSSKWLPTLSLATSEAFSPRASLNARVCFRTSTIDRLPYIGALPDYELFNRQIAQFRSGTNLANRVTFSPVSGIFVNVGHGSRGLLSCPVGAEIIARQIVNAPLAELANVAQITSPERLPLRLHRASESGA